MCSTILRADVCAVQGSDLRAGVQGVLATLLSDGLADIKLFSGKED
jgi:UDP-N-acetylglucosamine enolpyruvyl transferase